MGSKITDKEIRTLNDIALQGGQVPSGYVFESANEQPWRKLTDQEASDLNRAAAAERAEAERVGNLPPVVMEGAGGQLTETPPAADAKS